MFEPDESWYFDQRKRMVVEQLRSRDIVDARVLHAMGTVPRELFVPERERAYAYSDGPLAIGYEQTISQPYIVASMTQLLDLRPDCRVLEIGTGSGYQTAILASLSGQVYSVEIVPELFERSSELLARLRFTNVSTYCGDGSLGWEGHAPFGGILVSAAARDVPRPLIDQLAEGAHLVIPVGSPGETQVLRLYRKTMGSVSHRDLYDVRFVPLRSSHPSTS